MVVFCDQIFHLPLEDNRTKRFYFTSEALLISSSWVKYKEKYCKQRLICFVFQWWLEIWVLSIAT